MDTPLRRKLKYLNYIMRRVWVKFYVDLQIRAIFTRCIFIIMKVEISRI